METKLIDRSDDYLTGLTDRWAPKSSTVSPPQLPDDAAAAWKTDHRRDGMKDRDRVFYSDAFQRLAHVTQVTAPEGNYVFHTRMGHSLKVAQIGRRNVERLQRMVALKHVSGAAARAIESLDPDAVEAGCLAHDLGHPPFGHIAEQELNRLTSPHVGDRDNLSRSALTGQFEGNAQSFRIITRLENTASSREGLGLMRQTLETALKYPWCHGVTDEQNTPHTKWGYYEADRGAFEWVRKFAPVKPNERGERALEAHIMDWADDLTYAVHDVQDFFRAGLIPLHLLANRTSSPAGKSVAPETLERFQNKLEELQYKKGRPQYNPEQLAGAVEQILQADGPVAPFGGTDEEISNLLRFGSRLISEFMSAFTVENRDNSAVLVIDDPARLQVAALKALVDVFVIERPSMAEVQHGQRQVIADLYQHYMWAANSPAGDTRTLPARFRAKLANEALEPHDVHRLVVDLVAGLTEEGAYRTHHRLLGRSRMTALH